MTKIIITIFFLIIFKETHTHKIEDLETALTNSLDSDCMAQRGIDNIRLTIRNTFKCVDNKFFSKQEKYEEETYEQTFSRLICTEDAFADCVQDMKTILNPCLSQQSQNVLQQIQKIVNAGVNLFCENFKENFQIVFNDECPDIENATTEFELSPLYCYNIFQLSDKTLELKDFFSAQRCENYLQFSDCFDSNFANCPSKQETVTSIYNAMYQASPCD